MAFILQVTHMFCIFINILFKFVPGAPIDNESVLVQVASLAPSHNLNLY